MKICNAGRKTSTFKAETVEASALFPAHLSIDKTDSIW